MAKKGHFKGTGKCLIHTSRDGTCHQGNCDYVKNTPDSSAPFEGWMKPRGSHHILCVSATIKYQGMYKGAERERIDEVYAGTKWCVDKRPNLMWLPLKGTYTSRKNKTGSRAEPGAIWRTNLPCHDWDHNCTDGFTDEVIEAFKARIWDKIQAAGTTKKCFTPEKMQTALKALEDSFRAKLRARGKRPGTLTAIRNEGKGTWWFSFSMAKTSCAAGRPVHAFGRKPDQPRAYARGGR